MMRTMPARSGSLLSTNSSTAYMIVRAFIGSSSSLPLVESLERLMAVSTVSAQVGNERKRRDMAMSRDNDDGQMIRESRH